MRTTETGNNKRPGGGCPQRLSWTPLCLGLLVSVLVALPGSGLLAAQAEEDANLLPQPVAPESVEPTVVGIDDYPDPFEPVNRVVFGFNDVAMRYLIIPLGRGYRTVLPQPVRTGVSRVFTNLQEPLNFLNHALRGEFSPAGHNLFRFLTNTTLGIGGLFDPAEAWFGVTPSDTSFNDTFRYYGMPQGPFLVLPFLGPTDVRGGITAITASALHPVRLVTSQPDTNYILVFDNFQAVAPTADAYLVLKEQADDPYVYFRNQYLQGVARDSAQEPTDEK